MSEDGVRLDWAAAEVHEGELTVPLRGETGKEFKRAFKATVRLLGSHAGWGDIELRKSAVRVRDVQAGSEDPLRHHLDSVILQAATTVAQEQAADAPPEDEKPAEQGPDAEMTARFRSYAEDGEAPGSEAAG